MQFHFLLTLIIREMHTMLETDHIDLIGRPMLSFRKTSTKILLCLTHCGWGDKFIFIILQELSAQLQTVNQECSHLKNCNSNLRHKVEEEETLKKVGFGKKYVRSNVLYYKY